MNSLLNTVILGAQGLLLLMRSRFLVDDQATKHCSFIIFIRVKVWAFISYNGFDQAFIWDLSALYIYLRVLNRCVYSGPGVYISPAFIRINMVIYFNVCGLVIFIKNCDPTNIRRPCIPKITMACHHDQNIKPIKVGGLVWPPISISHLFQQLRPF